MRKAANSLKVTVANDCFDIYVSVTRKVPMLFRKSKQEKLIFASQRRFISHNIIKAANDSWKIGVR